MQSFPVYISTPEHNRTAWGTFFVLYIATGTLYLRDDELVIDAGTSLTTIKKGSVRDITLGHHSRIAKPIKTLYLDIRYEQEGIERTLRLAGRPSMSWVWKCNEMTLEMRHALLRHLDGTSTSGESAATR